MRDAPNRDSSVAYLPAWAKALAGITVLILIAGLLVPYIVNVDRYRPAISGAIAGQTGRKVTLGKMNARVFPYVGFDVAETHMGNPDGFVAGEFLSARRVRARVGFWALVLRREVRLVSLELLGPKLVLL